VAQICAASISVLPEDEPVLGWGWSAWSVYHHCHRLAPGPIYKELGAVTTANTNTCSDSRGRPIRWRPGPSAEAYLAALRAHPPSLVLISPYYRVIGDGRDPLADWDALRQELEQRYVVLRAPRGFSVLLRRDLASKVR
jgi:hypothetical protein